MDNIGEILIFAIFIIISIFNSIAKKKRKEAKSQEESTVSESRPEAPRERARSILDDIFNDVPEKRDPEYNYGGSGDTYHDHSWDPAEEFGLKTVKPAPVTEIKGTIASTQNRYNDIMKEMELKKLRKSEPVLVEYNKPKSNKSIRKNKFARILHNPESLKEYILVSAILDKPKALRK
ncbi:MAG: hypothetical protein KKA84_00590 [Bacteroidetes bacterium]|nr:hypothetical protein [Bacteroidota bacterium]